MSAIDTALSTIDQIASEGDLAPERPTDPLELDVADRSDPAAGRQADLPAAAARRADRRARLLADRRRRPAESTFLRLIGPPGSGK